MRWRLTVAMPLLLLAAAGCHRQASSEGESAGMNQMEPEARTTGPLVRVRLIGPDGKLGKPIEEPQLVLSDLEWQARLTPEQYRITRGRGTERAFCGGLLTNKEAGMYVCVCCDLPLFESAAKFESGTGWPSFFRPVAAENIREEADRGIGMVRTEILCRRCGAHLGHVFDDGPPPTGRRYT